MGYKYNNGSRYGRSYGENNENKEKCYKLKCHNHEFLSSTDLEEDDEGQEHNHRIAGVTGPPIRQGMSHIHRIEEFTDTFGDHFHKICDTTGPAIWISKDKHIHLVKGETSVNDGHDHDYYFTTLIEDPSNVPENGKC